MTTQVGHRLPAVLSIAGSDSSGGAGIQTDIKTCSASGCYCMTAVTAVTAQSSGGVKMIEPTSIGMLIAQMECAMECVRPDAIKIGLLPHAHAVKGVADFIKSHQLKNVVTDPVLSATCGGEFSDDRKRLLAAMIENLFPLSTLVTPNIPELDTLFMVAGIERNMHSEEERTFRLLDIIGTDAILVKGGHTEGDICVDRLYTSGGETARFDSERIDTPHTHGTGCTLSSAIACGLASGKNLTNAIADAKRFLTRALIRGREFPVFSKYGPLCHFMK